MHVIFRASLSLKGRHKIGQESDEREISLPWSCSPETPPDLVSYVSAWPSRGHNGQSLEGCRKSHRFGALILLPTLEYSQPQAKQNPYVRVRKCVFSGTFDIILMFNRVFMCCSTFLPPSPPLTNHVTCPYTCCAVTSLVMKFWSTECVTGVAPC